ncbi:uncharacterized protein N7498_006463 [Penicillium cinerascens]|uniref:Uncharacterized protein n=1 Tax=Penicillium cinerascens TaxID=70096 RepID=A0A9W9SXQ9_9EURO|nr:uncharacterized protein N7498_006463 [Penicillium cinerascens]KAJ5201800.1 hypothetical protein N7498_006463 [Penicillium cinerascens]
MAVTRSNQDTRKLTVKEASKPDAPRTDQNTAADGCQRCFLRLEKNPDHTCESRQRSRSCRYCLQVRHKCKPLPREVYPAVVAALEKTGEERKEAILVVRQMIRLRTRRLRSEKRARDEQLQRERRATFKPLSHSVTNREGFGQLNLFSRDNEV